MILAIDVHYQDTTGIAGGLLFQHWEDATPSAQYITKTTPIRDYIPGEFYKRELPCIVNLLTEHQIKPACIVIDGYVYLDGTSKPGLGAHLFETLNKSIPIIGVAKTAFIDISAEFEIFRGSSKRPLYVTCAGIDRSIAKDVITKMHGKGRIPTLLKAVDRLCRRENV